MIARLTALFFLLVPAASFADTFQGTVESFHIETGRLTVREAGSGKLRTFGFGTASRVTVLERPTPLILFRPGWKVSVEHKPGSSTALRVNSKDPQAGEPQSVASSSVRKSSLVLTQRGTLPIILSAPHGGTKNIPGVPARKNSSLPRFVTTSDLNTKPLAVAVAAQLEEKLNGKPYFVFADFHRKFVDANRSPGEGFEHPLAGLHYRAYHDALTDSVREVALKFGGGILIDVHGQARYPDVIVRGTRGGRTLHVLAERHGWERSIEGPRSLLGFLRKKGHRTYPENRQPKETVYTGGFITASYGQPFGVDSIQLEFGRNLRVPRAAARKSAEDLAEAIASFYSAFLE